jgi:peptide/nickel transport system permease protein
LRDARTLSLLAHPAPEAAEMHPVLRTTLQRLGLGVLTLFVVSLIVFFSVELLPGSFAQAILGQSATPETVRAFNEELGLDRPAPVRYLVWLEGIAHGDFGYSYAGGTSETRRKVADLVLPRLYNTLFLAGLAAIFAVPFSLLLGIAAALFRDSWFDRTVNTLGLIAVALPDFLIAYGLIFVFAITLHWLPVLSMDDETSGFLGNVAGTVLPALSLALGIVAHMMRMTRTALVNLLATSYVEMAELKGLSRARIMVRHVLPNAWAPIATVVASNLAYLVVSVVVVEVVFAYPGIGQLMVDAVSSRDFPTIQACTIIFAATYILLNLAADVVAIATNPKLLHPR